MASSKSQFSRARLANALFATAAALTRLDPTGRLEQAFRDRLFRRYGTQPLRLQSLAWHAEVQEDLAMALESWRAIAECATRGSNFPVTKVYSKMATLETKIRRQVGYFTPEAVPDLGLAPAVRLTDDKFTGHERPGSRNLRREARALMSFWTAVRAMPESNQARLRKAYAALSTQRNRAGRQHIALSALQPVLAVWPDYQTAYPQFYKATLQTILDGLELHGGEDPWQNLDNWWAFFGQRHASVTESARDQIWSLTLRFAQKLQNDGRMDAAERVMTPTFDHWDDNAAGLTVLAKAAEARRDWVAAAGHWQLYAAIMNPVSTKSGTIVADNAEERIRKANYARSSLRAVRAEVALEAHAAGRRREFRELAARIVESLPDQRLLKYDTRLLQVAQLYVQDALREDGAFHPPEPLAPGKLRRVVLCLDILKVSDVHTHSRVIFTMCRNMLRHDPDLEIHVVITNERFAVTTPVVSPSFNPRRDSQIEERAHAALGDLVGTRFHVQVHHYSGLEGVVRSARQILDLRPDLVLYGGGHRGLFSNESRLVRHALYDLLPAALFYIQSNNEVDPKFDMIIARGPHRIEGQPGEASIRIQPYPTIVVEELDKAQTAIDLAKANARTLVSAITGVRMDVRLSEMSAKEMKSFFSILDRVPGAIWHFIGCKDIKAVRKANKEIARRMDAGQIVLHTVMPFEDFSDLVGNASLFLHLPGFTGGSGGAAVARRGAIPILTFNHSDVSGRQPPETVFSPDNLKGFADMAVRLLTDTDQWCEVAQMQINHTNWIRETSVEGFHDCLSVAMRLGRARTTRGLPPAVLGTETETPDSEFAQDPVPDAVEGQRLALRVVQGSKR